MFHAYYFCPNNLICFHCATRKSPLSSMCLILVLAMCSSIISSAFDLRGLWRNMQKSGACLLQSISNSLLPHSSPLSLCKSSRIQQRTQIMYCMHWITFVIPHYKKLLSLLSPVGWWIGTSSSCWYTLECGLIQWVYITFYMSTMKLSHISRTPLVLNSSHLKIFTRTQISPL